MSRVGKVPITVPRGVELRISDNVLSVKGSKGSLEHIIHGDISVSIDESIVQVSTLKSGKAANALAGTTRAVVANMVKGVSDGFERRLQLVGVGYRAQMKGQNLGLTLGHSHPIEYKVPDGISVETPTQTEVIVRGVDRQRVGQVAAEIRSFRPPEPYKGKGVKYSDEVIVRKEAKKK